MKKVVSTAVALCIGYALGAVTPAIADEIKGIKWTKDGPGWMTSFNVSKKPTAANTVYARFERDGETQTKYRMAIGEHVFEVFAPRDAMLIMSLQPGGSAPDVRSYAMVSPGTSLQDMAFAYVPKSPPKAER